MKFADIPDLSGICKGFPIKANITISASHIPLSDYQSFLFSGYFDKLTSESISIDLSCKFDGNFTKDYSPQTVNIISTLKEKGYAIVTFDLLARPCDDLEYCKHQNESIYLKI